MLEVSFLIKKPTPAHSGRGDKRQTRNINIVDYN